MSKKDFRIYCEEEYIDHLKTIADEKMHIRQSVGYDGTDQKVPNAQTKKGPDLYRSDP